MRLTALRQTGNILSAILSSFNFSFSLGAMNSTVNETAVNTQVEQWNPLTVEIIANTTYARLRASACRTHTSPATAGWLPPAALRADMTLPNISTPINISVGDIALTLDLMDDGATRRLHAAVPFSPPVSPLCAALAPTSRTFLTLTALPLLFCDVRAGRCAAPAEADAARPPRAGLSSAAV